MVDRLQRVPFLTPVISNEAFKNERFSVLGRLAENVWNVLGKKHCVTIISQSPFNHDFQVDYVGYKKQSCLITAIKVLAITWLFPVLFAAKCIYRTSNNFYISQQRPITDDLVNEFPFITQAPTHEPLFFQNLLEDTQHSEVELPATPPIEEPRELEIAVNLFKTQDINDLYQKGEELLFEEDHLNAIKYFAHIITRLKEPEEYSVKLAAYRYAIKCLDVLVLEQDETPDSCLEEMSLSGLVKLFDVSYLQYVRKYLELEEETDLDQIEAKLTKKNTRTLSTRKQDMEAIIYSCSELIHSVGDYNIDTLELPARYSASVSTTKGKRSQQEDAFLGYQLRAENAYLYAVMDGHGDNKKNLDGDQCSTFVKDHLGPLLDNALQGVKTTLEIWNVLKKIPVQLHDLWVKNTSCTSGTTLCAALHWLNPETQKNELWIFNVGDSRAIVAVENTGAVYQLSTDARYSPEKSENPADKSFVDSVNIRNGQPVKVQENDEDVYRLDNLQSVRAIGNQNVAGLSARPEISRFDLSQHEGHRVRLILCTDGLTDVIGSQKIAHIISGLDNQKASNILVEEAIHLQSNDNITVMVMDL